MIRAATAHRLAPTISGRGERIEHPPRTRDERGRAADAPGARDIPGMGGDEPELLERHAQPLRGQPVRLGGRLEPPDGVGGERLLEEVAQPGMRQLRLADRRGRVGQRGEAQARVAQLPEALPHLGMGGELAHPLPERLPILFGERHPAARGDHRERAQAERPEIAVGRGDGRDQGGSMPS